MQNSINSELFYKKDINFDQDVCLVPTSAWTGEGIPDLLATMTKVAMYHLKKKLKVKQKFRAAVLECNKQEGLGATIDIVLVNGTLQIGDKIAFLGFDGA
jgi:translation initiation factor 5B